MGFHSDKIKIWSREDENKAPNLKEIIIEDGNPVLGNDVVRDFAKDGIWYQTDCEANETTLIFYPPAKENETFKVPSFIKILDSHCFHYNPHIKKIIMPKNFNGIVEEFAFSNCKNLETIVFQSYIEVKEDFFINCPNLKQVIAETPTPYKIEK